MGGLPIASYKLELPLPQRLTSDNLRCKRSLSLNKDLSQDGICWGRTLVGGVAGFKRQLTSVADSSQLLCL